MKLGNANVNKIRLGSTQMKRVYLGSNIVWQNAPTAIAATGVGTTSFTANWEAYSGAVVYYLDVSETSDFSTFVYENEIVYAPNTSYVVIGLQSNTTYYYRIRASDTDPDYEAIISYATTQGYTLPTQSQRATQQQLLINLKVAGIWNKLDSFSVFATNGDEDFALIDWKRLTQYTAVNSPSFTPNQGFKGNGFTSYINTNFKPLSNGVNFSQNNASMGIFRRIFGGTGSVGQMGVAEYPTPNNAVTWLVVSRGFNLSRFNDFGPQGIPTNNINSTGLISMNRVNNTTYNFYDNGILHQQVTQTTTGLPNLDMFVLTLSDNGTPSQFTQDQFSMVFMGADLTNEQVDFTNILNNYLNAL
jgi:hypothetical protein